MEPKAAESSRRPSAWEHLTTQTRRSPELFLPPSTSTLLSAAGLGDGSNDWVLGFIYRAGQVGRAGSLHLADAAPAAEDGSRAAGDPAGGGEGTASRARKSRPDRSSDGTLGLSVRGGEERRVEAKRDGRGEGMERKGVMRGEVLGDKT
eukprot:182821-Hanusia_phi.AAC.1